MPSSDPGLNSHESERKSHSYAARIGSRCIASEVPYYGLLSRIVECTVRGAIARSIGEGEWEYDLLRRDGISSLEIFRDRKAVWVDSESFMEALAEARREHLEANFKK